MFPVLTSWRARNRRKEAAVLRGPLRRRLWPAWLPLCALSLLLAATNSANPLSVPGRCTACTAHGSGRRPGSPAPRADGLGQGMRLARGFGERQRALGPRGLCAHEVARPRVRGHPSRARPYDPGHAARTGASPRPAPPPPRAGPCPDLCQAPAKSPRVTCASAEAGCGAPGLVWVPVRHSVLLSGRAAASEGTQGSDAKAAGSRRTQADRTRAAMATPTQGALRAPVGPRAARGRRRGPGAGGPWRPLAALRPGCGSAAAKAEAARGCGSLDAGH